MVLEISLGLNFDNTEMFAIVFDEKCSDNLKK